MNNEKETPKEWLVRIFRTSPKDAGKKVQFRDGATGIVEKNGAITRVAKMPSKKRLKIIMRKARRVGMDKLGNRELLQLTMRDQ